MVSGRLAPELVPRTMLSLAHLGGAPVWRHEMDALAEQALQHVGMLSSLRAVNDVGRALRLTRHKGDERLLNALDARGGALLEEIMQHDTLYSNGPAHAAKIIGLAASIASNIVYAGVLPRQLLARLLACTTSDDLRAQLAVDVRFVRAASMLGVCAHRVLGWAGEEQHAFVTAVMGIIRESMSGTEAERTLCDQITGREVPKQRFREDLDGRLGRIRVREDERRAWDDRDLASIHPFLLSYCNEDDPLLERSIEAKRRISRRHTISVFQKQVYDVLCARLGYTCAMEGDVRGVSVDILVEHRGVAVECNGNSHYYRNADGMVPCSQLKTMLVEEGGLWRLLNVDQRDWDAIEGREEAAAWLREKI